MQPITDSRLKQLNMDGMVDSETAKSMAVEAAELALRKSREEQLRREELVQQSGGGNIDRDNDMKNESDESGYEDDDYGSGMLTINPKFQRDLKNTLGIMTALTNVGQKNAPQPSRMQSMVEEKMWGIVGNVLDKSMGGSIGADGVVKKSSFLIELLNTETASAFGGKLAERLPETLTVLRQSLGDRRLQDISDNIQERYAGGGSSGGSSDGRSGGSSEVEEQKDKLLRLNPDSPNDVVQYANAMGYSMNGARSALISHQNDIISSRRGSQTAQRSVSIPASVPSQQQSEYVQQQRPEYVQSQQNAQQNVQQQNVQPNKNNNDNVGNVGNTVGNNAGGNVSEQERELAEQVNTVLTELLNKITNIESQNQALQKEVSGLQTKIIEMEKYKGTDSDISKEGINDNTYEQKPMPMTDLYERKDTVYPIPDARAIMQPNVMLVDDKWTDDGREDRTEVNNEVVNKVADEWNNANDVTEVEFVETDGMFDGNENEIETAGAFNVQGIQNKSEIQNKNKNIQNKNEGILNVVKKDDLKRDDLKKDDLKKDVRIEKKKVVEKEVVPSSHVEVKLETETNVKKEESLVDSKIKDEIKLEMKNEIKSIVDTSKTDTQKVDTSKDVTKSVPVVQTSIPTTTKKPVLTAKQIPVTKQANSAVKPVEKPVVSSTVSTAKSITKQVVKPPVVNLVKGEKSENVVNDVKFTIEKKEIKGDKKDGMEENILTEIKDDKKIKDEKIKDDKGVEGIGIKTEVKKEGIKEEVKKEEEFKKFGSVWKKV